MVATWHNSNARYSAGVVTRGRRIGSWEVILGQACFVSHYNESISFGCLLHAGTYTVYVGITITISPPLHCYTQAYPSYLTVLRSYLPRPSD
jgi:hypothetical protein